MKKQAPGFRIPPVRAAACMRRPEVLPRLPASQWYVGQRRRATTICGAEILQVTETWRKPEIAQ